MSSVKSLFILPVLRSSIARKFGGPLDFALFFLGGKWPDGANDGHIPKLTSVTQEALVLQAHEVWQCQWSTS
jgi:hypothetical protein